MPQVVCSACIDKVNTAHNLVKNIVTNHEKLKYLTAPMNTPVSIYYLKASIKEMFHISYKIFICQFILLNKYRFEGADYGRNISKNRIHFFFF